VVPTSLVLGMSLVMAVPAAAANAPTVVGAGTNVAGTVIGIGFNKNMADPTGKHGEFSCNIGGTARTFSAAALKAGDPMVIHLTVQGAAIASGDVVTVSYEVGTVVAQDAGVLASFTEQAVINNAQAPNLGAAASFGVLGEADVTLTTSNVTGDVGSAGHAVVNTTGSTSTGTIYPVDAPQVDTAYTAFLTAYGLFAAVDLDGTLEPVDYPDGVVTGSLAGVTLSPGVYSFDLGDKTGILTLDAGGDPDAVWIFKSATPTGYLTGSSFQVVMANCGVASNVFWWVSAHVALTTSHFQGTILAGSYIAVTGPGTFNGRALATDYVTFTNVVAPVLAAYLVEPEAGPYLTGTPFNITITAVDADGIPLGAFYEPDEPYSVETTAAGAPDIGALTAADFTDGVATISATKSTHDICFNTEAFCSLFAETALEAANIPEFIDRAVDFVNGILWGTLTASILIHPKSLVDPSIAASLERALMDLRYGTIGINESGATAFSLVRTPWGGFPGHDIYDVQSGIGVTNNTLMFNKPQKTVIRGPFKKTPDSNLVTFRHFPELQKKFTYYLASPSIWRIPGLVWSVFRG
jgi:hypothetical protein